MVRLSNVAYRRIRDFWAQFSSKDCGMAWDPTSPTELLFTDASDTGFGAHLSKLTINSLVSGLWTPSLALHHITYKELHAVELALKALGPLLVHRNLAIFSDSSVVVNVLRKLYTKSHTLRASLARIVHLMRVLDVRF